MGVFTNLSILILKYLNFYFLLTFNLYHLNIIFSQRFKVCANLPNKTIKISLYSDEILKYIIKQKWFNSS